MKVFISQPMRNIPNDEVLRIREEGKKKFLEIYKGKEEVACEEYEYTIYEV